MYEDTVFTVNDLGSRPRHANKVKSYNLIKFCEKINWEITLSQSFRPEANFIKNK